MRQTYPKNIVGPADTALPNFLVIGAMKCGTTSLHHYLSLHPQIFMSRQKELHYFVEERNWSKGEAWYRNQFESGYQACGETSPTYSAYPALNGVPQRIHRLLGDIRIVYVVRNPMERLLSQYIHVVAKGKETRPFKEIVTDLQSDYVWRSRYAEQLKQYLPYFPRERILLITQESLLADRQSTLQQVCRFLGVSDHITFSVTRELHSTSSKRRPNAAARSIGSMLEKTQLSRFSPRLAGFAYQLLTYPFSEPIDRPILDENRCRALLTILQQDVQCLEELTGQTFPEWNLMRH